MNRIIDSARKATESSVAMQQELFRKWASLWLGAPVTAIPFGELQKFQKKWVEIVVRGNRTRSTRRTFSPESPRSAAVIEPPTRPPTTIAS